MPFTVNWCQICLKHHAASAHVVHQHVVAGCKCEIKRMIVALGIRLPSASTMIEFEHGDIDCALQAWHVALPPFWQPLHAALWCKVTHHQRKVCGFIIEQEVGRGGAKRRFGTQRSPGADGLAGACWRSTCHHELK